VKRIPPLYLLTAVVFLVEGTLVSAGSAPRANGDESITRAAASRLVHTASFSWRDHDRCRTVPVTIYYPSGDDADLPVILFSHGLGRSRHACAYLGRYWAGKGYVSVHVEHLGSNEAVWRGSLRAKQRLRAAFYSRANRRNRPQDISFAIDRREEMEAAGHPLGARLNLTRVGTVGHDFGAQTSLVLAGEMLPGEESCADSRIKAVVAMSTPVPPGESLDKVFGPVEVPCLHVTGTRDDSLVATTRANQRRLPFDTISAADQYLVTFCGADHLIYAGHPLPRRNRDRNDGGYQRRLRLVTTLFWDAYLRGDTDARRVIANGGLAETAGRIARVEQKAAAPFVSPVSSADREAE